MTDYKACIDSIEMPKRPIKSLSTQEINKRFAELAGLPYHECKTKGMDGKIYVHSDPDFCADPLLVLKVMMKREDWRDFTWLSPAFIIGDYPLRPENGNVGLRLDYLIDTTGLLALKGIEWLQQQDNRRGDRGPDPTSKKVAL